MIVRRTAMLLIHLGLFVFLDVASPVDGTAAAAGRRRQVLLQEKATLLALKRGFILPSPSSLADWNESNGHVCRFTGVTCDRRREHVIGLELANMGISGPIPPVIGELSHLRSLDMSNNSISGAVPPPFGNLVRLQNLNMASNHISGAFLSVLGNLSQLQGLNMSSNNISGAIPPSISNLTRLDMLLVSDNFLSGAIPPAAGNLTSLRTLVMYNNHLTGKIPTELSKLRKLGDIELQNNHLHGGIPPSISELKDMWFLNLMQNNLSGPIPEAIFLNWTALGVLDLATNNLSGEIPRTASSSLADTFAWLNLNTNKLTGALPPWLANCTRLLWLVDVENNMLSDELPTSIISGKQNLTYLHLSNNQFRSQDKNSNLEPFFAALSNCSSLQELEVAAVGLGGRLPSGLGSMLPHSLLHLNLEMNAIEGPIPANIWHAASSMTLLNLSSNMLNGTIPASLCRLQNLQQLVLSDNALTGEIPPCIGNATSLGELDLSGNMLSGKIPGNIGSHGRLNYLSLQRNMLSGAIPPSLGQCGSLLLLDLSSNRLSGAIPEEVAGIAKITLNLSRNQLCGKLPAGLGKMLQVQTIDLSWNNFTGEISAAGLEGCVELAVLDLSRNSLSGALPSSLGGLKNLESLDVSNNFLTGEIPVSLTKCSKLKHLDLSYNDFGGAVPTTGAFAQFSLHSYLGNPQLCGQVVHKVCSRTHHKTHKLLVVMCRVSALVLALVLMILCTVCARKISDRPAALRDRVGHCSNTTSASSQVMKVKHPRITYRELVDATENFSLARIVGKGSYGQIYRGTLGDGTEVAVKVIRQLQSGSSTSKSFSRECQVLKRIRHRNIVRVITACSLPDFKALVLPFMANGSLERYLYAAAELSLVQRVNICSDVAEGMAYLHHYSPVKVIHCDLKPSNILINDDMTALVSDFGISRPSVMSASVSTGNVLLGSIGYIPPEYGYGSSPTTKGDVYSFGVLVLEMLTRRKPTDDMFEAGLSLHDWVRGHGHDGHTDAVLDSALARMVRDQTPEVKRKMDMAIRELLELGILCSQENPSARPTMTDAATSLNQLKRYAAANFPSSLGMGFSPTTVEVDEDID
ncbi:unnamed protein product [Urochloa decumbens]|uniref:non-specific serine/threonine protein kinase n=1 Tax=Urochloa decumbens TaxID=240449 RepID=A0ABC9G6F1_9POAL